jgi:hypothetical protein
MSKVEASIVHAYTEKLRQQQAQIEVLSKKLQYVRWLLDNHLPTDDKLILLHKIKIVVNEGSYFK